MKVPDDLDLNPLIVEKFWAKVAKCGPIPAHRPDLGPCWIWMGAFGANRYPGVKINDRNYRANRVAWYLEHGRWPKCLACHHCDNKACVRPSHIFDGDTADNSRDYWIKRLTEGMAC